MDLILSHEGLSTL